MAGLDLEIYYWLKNLSALHAAVIGGIVSGLVIVFCQWFFRWQFQNIKVDVFLILKMMKHTYELILKNMEMAVNDLAGRVQQPQLINIKKLRAYRHVEKTIYQAIVQKLARMVSTLEATRLLANHGFVQEQASLQRILDEIQEDIWFLALGIIYGQKPLHRRYVDAFFEEEFDADSAYTSSQKRPMIPRKKIHAYLANTEASPMDPSRGKEVFRTVGKIYSGYVHAASTQIMDMYDGEPPRFQMRGMKGTKKHEAYKKQLCDYFYRGTCTFVVAAKAFGNDGLSKKIYHLLSSFEQVTDQPPFDVHSTTT